MNLTMKSELNHSFTFEYLTMESELNYKNSITVSHLTMESEQCLTKIKPNQNSTLVPAMQMKNETWNERITNLQSITNLQPAILSVSLSFHKNEERKKKNENEERFEIQSQLDGMTDGNGSHRQSNPKSIGTWISDTSLNFFNPCVGQYLAGVFSTRIKSLEVKIESKTKDNVFVQIISSYQYRVLKQNAGDAFYEL
ncbi:hypothetical protein L1887_38935 [Cichorium endivia]|nr:hypothetical protein L1887_38935 [Cichorium endivia]